MGHARSMEARPPSVGLHWCTLPACCEPRSQVEGCSPNYRQPTVACCLPCPSPCRQAKALVVSVLSPIPLLQQRLERAARGGAAGESPAGRGPTPPQHAGEMSELALNDVLEVAIAALRPCALRVGDPLGLEEELAGLVLAGGGGQAVEAAIRMGMVRARGAQQAQRVPTGRFVLRRCGFPCTHPGCRERSCSSTGPLAHGCVGRC